MTPQLKRILIIFSISLNIGFIIVTGFTLLHDNDHGKQRGGFGSKYIDRIKELNLNRQQQNHLEPLIETYVKEAMDLKRQVLQHKINSFHILNAQGSPDMQALEKEQAAIETLEIQKERIRYQHFAAIRKTLTEPQAEQFFSGIIRHLETRK